MNDDVKLVGTTRSNGGKFGNLRIVGESELLGRTECRTLNCTGKTRVEGELEAGNVKLTGELTVEGSLAAKEAALTGQVEVRGNCRGERFKLMGELRVGGSFEYETCKLTGAVSVEGLLSAERLEVRLHGPSRAREIGGGTITVKPSRMNPIKRLFVPGGSGDMTADSIEGDHLDLTNTTAKVVRGNQVRIGPGCRIDRIEYRHSLTRAKGAQIGTEIKID